jgi:hypothetical protein
MGRRLRTKQQDERARDVRCGTVLRDSKMRPKSRRQEQLSAADGQKPVYLCEVIDCKTVGWELIRIGMLAGVGQIQGAGVASLDGN